MQNQNTKRLFFIPRVTAYADITDSLAVLKALLLGYRIPLTDAQLTSALTEVIPPDSSAALIQIAHNCGVEMQQALLPVDALQLPNALPVLVRLRPISEQPAHWAVVWNRIGPFFQVLDPQLGRLWLGATQLLTELESEELLLTAAEWRALSTSEPSRQFLQGRLLTLQLTTDQVNALLADAYAPTRNYGPAALDAATRTVERMVQQNSVRRGAEAAQMVQQTWRQTITQLVEKRHLLAPANWSALPDLTAENLEQASVHCRGITGLRIIKLLVEPVASQTKTQAASPKPATASTAETLPTAAQPAKQSVLMYLRQEGIFSPALIALAMIFAGAGIFFQAILFRSLSQLSLRLETVEQRLWTIGLLLAFTLTLLGLKWFSHRAVLKLGHRLDARLRLAVLSQIPRLSTAYFQHISPGEMIERIHNVRAARKLPFYASELLHIFFQFLMTIVGLCLLDWLSALLTFIKMLVPFAVMFISGYIGSEAERAHLYLGFLSRFYLDAMQGLVAIRTHGAEQATRREYEDLLGKWVQSNINVYLGEWWLNTFSTAISYLMTALIIVLYVVRGRDPANLLLLTYWSVNLESLRGPLIFLTISYLFDQGKAMRFLHLLEAPTEEDLAPKADMVQPAEMISLLPDAPERKGLAITFQQVRVELAEQEILHAVDLHIPAGSQIAIVGPSGAGKSTLVGLLLGWHYPADGRILIDGELLDYARLQQLRSEMAWVDPTIQLWNRSFLYNLRYGGGQIPMNFIIEQADLRTVLERLPEGMQTRLGGEGRLISGGEGQRARFGRGMQRQDARLVVLDEPFRGLDRDKRRTLLASARAYWPAATLICVTHDVGQTQSFERVLVVEEGGILEDGAPSELLARPGSRYKALLDAEDAVREKLWASEAWRRLWLENGQIREAV